MRPVLLTALLLLGGCTAAAPTDDDTGGDTGDSADLDTAPPVDTAWICAPDDAVCDGLCTATRFDEQACGDCDTVCSASQVCDEGMCIARPQAAACDADTRADILAEATVESPFADLDCSLTLEATDVVTKKLRLTGPEASGITIDCQGGTLRRTLSAGGSDMIQIASRKTSDTTWDRPTDITIRACRIEGSIRILGQGVNGEAPDVSTDSHSLGHRERAQQAAPSRILLEGLTLVGDGRIPLYLSPGTTEVTLRDSVLEGRTVSTTIYMDAESARHTLVNNTFDAVQEGNPLRREVLAVDGSADNVIAGNTFAQPAGGGLYVYRNCGEGGTVRHQEPRRNVVSGNVFEHPLLAGFPDVWVGSRVSSGLARIYCPLDDGYDFGSSIDDSDFAKNTVVAGNRFVGDAPDPALRADDGPTVDVDNTLVATTEEGAVSCAIFRHHAAPRIVAAGTRVRGRVCREGRLVTP